MTRKTTQPPEICRRSADPAATDGMNFRSFTTSPETFDEKARRVRATLATEAPVEIFDRDFGDFIPEILPMDAIEMPVGKRMVLLDTHRIVGISNVLGSCVEMETKAPNLDTWLEFSDDADGERAMKKVRGGHLRDLSIGYRVFEKVIVPANTTAVVNGRAYTGPLRVAVRWAPFEGSLCPIGADQGAKTRAKTPGEDKGNASTVRAESKKRSAFQMNPKLMALLIQRGLAAGSTDEEAMAFLSRMSTEDQSALRKEAGLGDPTPTTPPVDVKAIEARAKAEGARAEAERQNEIRSMCAAIDGCGELVEELVKPGISVQDARAKVVEHLKTNRKPAGNRTVTSVADERDKFRAAAEHAIMLRAGLVVETPAAGAAEIRGMSLLRLAEEALIRANQPHRFTDPSELIARAFSTSDFTGILGTSANRVMQRAYSEADETWETWVEIGEGRDFKAMIRPQLSEAPALQLVNENGQENMVAFAEFAPSFTIQTYDAVVKLTRQLVINDDLQAFLRVPQAFGRASQRKIGDLVYAILTTNAAINTTGSSLALFHSSHSNLLNPALPLSFDGINEMRRLFRVQTGRNSVVLGLKQKFLIVPAALESLAEQLCFSTYLPEKGAGPIENILKGRIVPVAEHRLDSDSTTSWYGATSPMDCAHLEVAFLNGVRQPVIQNYEGTNPDERKFRVRIDVGVGAKDHRGLQKSAA